jgi:transposase
MVSDVPRTRPAYPPEFRREAIELLRQGRTPGELSKSLGVSPQTLGNWRRKDELDHLRRENTRLRQERDLLKRAAAFFATENGTR